MKKSVSFVVDLGAIIVLLTMGSVGVLMLPKPSILPQAQPAPKDDQEQARRRPLLPRLRGEMDEEPGSTKPGKISLGDVHPPDGSRVQIDFPLSRDMRNIRSKIDGAGMCVTTSAEMAADWAGITELKGFRDFCAREPGGCGPTKFDDQLRRYCKKRGIPVPNYLFYLGKDPGVLELVLRSGRMPACSYAGRDGVQYTGSIAHVNNLIHFADGIAGVYDNNYDPTKRIWMDWDSYISRWTDGGNGWAIVWLDPPPPPKLKGV